MEYPTVSILMTAYNREQFIEESIQSILNSDFKDFELLIVDDCSSDNTLTIAKEYEKKDQRVKVIKNEHNLGDYRNRNKAASLATGKYLKYVDSDDILYPYSLGAFVDAMEKYPTAAIGLCNTSIDDYRLYPFQLDSYNAYFEHYLKKGFLDIGPTGVIIRRDKFEELGGFSEERHIGDTYLWLRLAAKYDVARIQPGLVWWRMHEGQEIETELKNPDIMYIRLNEELRILNSQFNPLKEKDKYKVLRKIKQNYARKILRIGLVKKKPKIFFRLFKNANITLFDLIQGFFPYYK